MTARGRFHAWRDVDSERRHFGFSLRWVGGELLVGRRCYRFRILTRGTS